MVNQPESLEGFQLNFNKWEKKKKNKTLSWIQAEVWR